MLSSSHGAEWGGPEGEEYCDAPAGEKSCFLGKLSRLSLYPGKILLSLIHEAMVQCSSLLLCWPLGHSSTDILKTQH